MIGTADYKKEKIMKKLLFTITICMLIIGCTTFANAGPLFDGVPANEFEPPAPAVTEPAATYSLTATKEGDGSVLPVAGNAIYGFFGWTKDSYKPGEEPEILATPIEGYHFVRWTGDASGTDNPLTVIMDRDKTISAVFAKNTTPDPTPVLDGSVTVELRVIVQGIDGGPDRVVIFPLSGAVVLPENDDPPGDDDPVDPDDGYGEFNFGGN